MLLLSNDAVPDKPASMNPPSSSGKTASMSMPAPPSKKNHSNPSECKAAVSSTSTVGAVPTTAASSATVSLSSSVGSGIIFAKPITSSSPSASTAAAAALIGGSGETITMPSCLASGVTVTMELLNKDGRIGIYLPDERKERIAKFHLKRKMRIWRKRIKYDCRKKLADSRPRIKGRFVRRSDVEGDNTE